MGSAAVQASYYKCHWNGLLFSYIGAVGLKVNLSRSVVRHVILHILLRPLILLSTRTCGPHCSANIGSFGRSKEIEENNGSR